MLAAEERLQEPQVSMPSQHPAWLKPSCVLPLSAGACVLVASFLPWLSEPLGKGDNAWTLPIDIGWQLHSSLLNYGLLCLCCAIYAILVGYAQWKPLGSKDYLKQHQVIVGLICLVPVALFLLQYLLIDVVGINQLAQHKVQQLLIQQHFGYRVAQERLSLSPFDVTTATLLGRLQILVDQIAVGPFLLCISTFLLLYSRHFVAAPVQKKHHYPIAYAVILVLLGILSRGPLAMVCQYEGKINLAAGKYASTLQWLHAAQVLNPALDQVSYFHIERGEALYFLQPNQQSDESSVYLASIYIRQGDYRAAYQQVLAAWQLRHSPWVVDELSLSLERLSEFIQPLQGPPVVRPDSDDSALPWVQKLALVDPSNVYSHYLVGRIQYDLHNYTEAMIQMNVVLQIGTNPDVASSAYTYMALSDAGQGNYVEERVLLLQAAKFDPNYHNNTAREELSGLR